MCRDTTEAKLTSIVAMQDRYAIEAVDISDYQGYNANGAPTPIDFVAAKATRPSLRWLIVKMGEGSWEGYPEKVFQQQITAGQAAGWDTSPYQFDHMDVPVLEQLAYMVKRYKGSYRGNMPLGVDFEDEFPAKYAHPKKPLTQAEIKERMPVALEMFDHTRDMLDAASQLSGQAAIPYSGAYYTDWYFWLASLAGKDMSWIKLYQWWMSTYDPLVLYLPFGMTIDDVAMWQWTSSPDEEHQVNGFPWKARLDMNYWIKTIAKYEALRRGGVIVPPVEPPAPNPEPGVQAQIQVLNQRMQTVEDLVSDLMLTRQKVREA